MPNYQLKAKVISSGKVQEFKKISRALYLAYKNESPCEKSNSNYDCATALERRSILFSDNPEEYRECRRVANANYEQTKRLKKRIEHMLTTSNECVFLTLTFAPDVMENTSPQTRRRYVQRFLKNNFSCFVANIDYGKENGREHYHAVANNRVDPHKWKYGALNVQKVRYNPEKYDSTKLAKYVAKLTNHAIKETTKRCVLIYSR